MRNALVYKLTNDIGHYASRIAFCELVLDGDYRGVYLIMEKIKREMCGLSVKNQRADTGSFSMPVFSPPDNTFIALGRITIQR